MLNYVSRSYLVSYVITIQTYSFFMAILIISRDPHIAHVVGKIEIYTAIDSPTWKF